MVHTTSSVWGPIVPIPCQHLILSDLLNFLPVIRCEIVFLANKLFRYLRWLGWLIPFNMYINQLSSLRTVCTCLLPINFIFSLLTYLLCILDINPLSDACTACIFPGTLSLSFKMVFDAQNFYLNVSIFNFMVCAPVFLKNQSFLTRES